MLSSAKKITSWFLLLNSTRSGSCQATLLSDSEKRSWRFAFQKVQFYILLGYGLLLLLACTREEVVVAEPTTTPTLPLCSGPASFPDLTTLPTPNRLDGIGSSHLTISTTNTTTQAWFDQGVNLLHGFYHLEAYRAFTEAARFDPDCAMAYWGMAMCQPGFGGSDMSRWDQALAKAVALSEVHTLTAVENDLIQALQTTSQQGLTAAANEWQNIVQQYAEESPDALAFAAIMLRHLVATDQQSENIKTMLELAMEMYPDHIGLGHYYTHVIEVRKDFIAGKEIAERMAALAPNAPHLTHMPGHIYFLEGEYAKTVATFEGARRQEEIYHRENNIPYVANQNYFHNLHYLAVTYSELGEKDKALEAAKRYANLSLRQQDQPLDGNATMILYEGRILPAMVHLRFREYDAAAKHLAFWLQHPSLAADHPMVRLYLSTLQTYCKGMANIEQGSYATAQSHFVQLDQHIQNFEEQGVAYANTSELNAINQVYDVMVLARLQLQGWLDNLDPQQAFNSSAWDEALALEQMLPYDEPPRLMYPVGESLLHLQLLRGDPKAASDAGTLALERRPNSPIIRRALPLESNKL